MTDAFEQRAKDYDARDLPHQLSAGIGAAIVGAVELHEGMRVMDFGAGTGLIAGRIVERVGRVTAVDISPAMLDKLAAKPALQGKVDIVCQNILEQPLELRFDLIVSAMAMHHVRDIAALARCFAAHLEPGGRVALADLDQEDGTFHPEDAPDVHHAGFDRADLQRTLERNGFEHVSFTTAVTVQREGHPYPVFLAVATKA